MGRESSCSGGKLGLIPGVGRPPGGGHGYPLQYSGLENSHGQRNLVGHGVAELDTTEQQSTAHSTTKSAILSLGKGIRSSNSISITFFCSNSDISFPLTSSFFLTEVLEVQTCICSIYFTLVYTGWFKIFFESIFFSQNMFANYLHQDQAWYSLKMHISQLYSRSEWVSNSGNGIQRLCFKNVMPVNSYAH